MPTLCTLKSRSLVVNTLCPIYKAKEEMVSHLFRNCVFSRQVLEGEGVQDIVGFINAYYLEVEQLGKLSITLSNPSVSFWEPSEGDVIKFHFDDSYNQQLHISRSGIITHNKEGM
ncbi:hypothetical protein Golob_023846, partial [Gossypium lobatum]|nr:hypothetical protein [Gossypium lobatum]